jgi:hypothetical protein
VVTEPATLLTDYALSGVTGWLAFRLFLRNTSRACRFWTLAFSALAFSALTGGTYHGFAIEGLWKPTVLVIGVASFGMVVGSAYAVTSGLLRRIIVWIALAKLAFYELWMLGHDAFVFVVVDTASALLAVAALHLCALDRPASRWILGGVALSLAAALVQAMRLAPHPSFNHNDLYHVMQIAAMALFYRGAVQLEDRALLSAAAATR